MNLQKKTIRLCALNYNKLNVDQYASLEDIIINFNNCGCTPTFIFLSCKHMFPGAVTQ